VTPAPPTEAGLTPPSPSQTEIRKKAGTSSAVSFSQYWKACTNVMLRMPPKRTLTSTTVATSSPPTQGSLPATVPRDRPAPWNWGRR
jgi:hypothetical protein